MQNETDERKSNSGKIVFSCVIIALCAVMLWYFNHSRNGSDKEEYPELAFVDSIDGDVDTLDNLIVDPNYNDRGDSKIRVSEREWQALQQEVRKLRRDVDELKGEKAKASTTKKSNTSAAQQNASSQQKSSALFRGTSSKGADSL